MSTHAVLVLGPNAPRALSQAVRKLGLETVTLSAEAAEVHLPEAQASRVAEALAQNPGYDIAVVPLAGREKKLLLCDMDSTIVAEETLDELAHAFGFGREVAAITEKAMKGEVAFEDALRARVSLFARLNIEDAAAALRARVTINPGAETLVRTMNARGVRTVLVTGGFYTFAAPIAERLGFTDVFANRLSSVDGILSGEVAEPILGPDAKRERLDLLCAEIGLDPFDVLAVGDGANDRGMVAAAGLGVGYRPKGVLAEVADVSLHHADLTALLALQGIPEAAWIR